MLFNDENRIKKLLSALLITFLLLDAITTIIGLNLGFLENNKLVAFLYTHLNWLAILVWVMLYLSAVMLITYLINRISKPVSTFLMMAFFSLFIILEGLAVASNVGVLMSR